MGRGRGKGRKSTGREDVVNGDEDKVPVQRRRGRPQKLFKGEMDEEVEKIEVEENPGMLNEKKRKTSSEEKEVGGIVDDLEEDGNGADGPPVRSVGFRQNGSRRKNKPRRAAEVGVECN
ncbi:uncharacterized protein LOC124918826 [Impatiens glandulifera]|uniref:uncharacterized protein LOC124918826 n=1 Tax=Impatiens glandulifera TaxID=253017 RepID=UPI001FB15046|nr:uncharacterized protein LOC124918826 [Impatiens glandulifera]